MLKHLSISNYAIIDNLELPLNDGFSVITGETGAGKSILLGALSLILGQRADTTILNNKDKKCIVEGTFEFNEALYLDFFKDNDLDFETQNIIRREITNNGKSRAFINDTPVNLQLLKELAENLIDIHSQHQTLQIQENNFQLNVVDSFSKISDILTIYRNKYVDYKKNNHLLEELIAAEKSASTDLDYIQFQIEEIEELNLKPNEKENILIELSTINNAEEIKSVLSYSAETLINSDKNILSEIKKIKTSFSKISNLSDEYRSIYDRLNSNLIELEDIANDIDKINNDFSFNPENLAYLNERLNAIYNIEQKHHLTSTNEIFEFLKTLKTKTSDIDSFNEKIIEQEKLVKLQQNELNILSKEISKKRQACFKDLCDRIVSNLNELGMPDAIFKIEHKVLQEINENGIDSVNFLFTSNKGFDTKELNKTASGGELSRLMLTIKSILAENNRLSTIVFDEIDTGVSGEIADKMASIMRKMSENIQVISITHLPQVAAKGKHHYKIYKESSKGKALTKMAFLSQKERIDELAKMLSGEKLSNAAVENAKNLLID